MASVKYPPETWHSHKILMELFIERVAQYNKISADFPQCRNRFAFKSVQQTVDFSLPILHVLFDAIDWFPQRNEMKILLIYLRSKVNKESKQVKAQHVSVKPLIVMNVYKGKSNVITNITAMMLQATTTTTCAHSMIYSTWTIIHSSQWINFDTSPFHIKRIHLKT